MLTNSPTCGNARAAPSQDHRALLSGLRAFYTCGDFFFVHAGIRPGVSLERQSEKDLLNIRNDFLSSRANFGKMVVHGHTPVEAPEIRANRIKINTGAFATGD